MAWVFCRGALIEVWNTILSLVPSFARMPSGPRFQPACSSSALALSTLNSKVLDHRFHETDHNGGIHLGFQAPIYCRVCP
jgi:hypothetical protein